MRVFRESILVCLSASFSFGFEDGMWDLIVLVPDHSLFTLCFKVGLLHSHICPGHSDVVNKPVENNKSKCKDRHCSGTMQANATL